MINKLKTMNESLITIYKNQPAELRRQELIKTILDEPEAFLKMSIETAYKVLEDLGYSVTFFSGYPVWKTRISLPQ